MKKCFVENCERKVVAKNYCANHYALWKRHGDPTVKKSRWGNHIKTQKKCANPNCKTMIWKNTYCGKCRQRKYRHGDVNIVLPKGDKEIWKKAKGGGAKHKYKLDSSILNEWSPELAYILGLTITDGCVETRKEGYIVAWQLKDREPLEIIQRLFKTDKPIEETFKHKGTEKERKYYRLRLCGKKIVEKFISYEVKPRKTFETRLPKIPMIFLPHFLRGVLDGDGCIYVRKINEKGYIRLAVIIASGNKEFLEDIKKIFIFGSITYNKIKGHACYHLTFDCSQAVHFLNFIYPNSERLRLSRKWDKWQEFLKSNQTYHI